MRRLDWPLIKSGQSGGSFQTESGTSGPHPKLFVTPNFGRTTIPNEVRIQFKVPVPKGADCLLLYSNVTTCLRHRFGFGFVEKVGIDTKIFYSFRTDD